jgi:aldose sugar dehydrogenase
MIISSEYKLQHPTRRQSFGRITNPEFYIFVSTLAVCLVAAYILLSRDPDSLIYYGDAVSHLMISRQVFDSITPGLVQFGAVWLPLTHIMLVPFVSFDYLFHTGLAGTIVSSLSTAVTSVLIFRISKLHFGTIVPGLVASIVFIINPSVVYMGLVPMMEAPFMMFFLFAVYYIQKWYYSYRVGSGIWVQYRILIKCALAVSATCLTRYEGWLLPFGLVALLLVILLVINKEPLKRRTEAIVIAVLPPGFAGMVLWIIWNTVLFRDPFWFATGPYSAHAQALARPYREHLYMQPIASLSVLYDVGVAMYGVSVFVVSLLGIGAFFYMGKQKRMLVFNVLTIFMLLIPLLANYVAMVQGSGEIYPVQEVGWYNGRYLIFLAPLLALASASLVAIVSQKRRRILTGLTISIILLSYLTATVTQPLEVRKTVAMSDTFTPLSKFGRITTETAKELHDLYTSGEIVMFVSSADAQYMMFKSDIPIGRFINPSSTGYWDISRHSPWIYGNYLIIQNLTSSSVLKPEIKDDPIVDTTEYWKTNENSLLQNYHLVYGNDYYNIFKRNNIEQETIVEGLKSPTDIAFLGPNDFLVLEKNEGIVKRVINGTALEVPLLDVNVANKIERGMLGITVSKNITSNGTDTYVFLYYTESSGEDGNDDCSETESGISCAPGNEPLGNRLYRYELIGNELVNPKLLLDLPAVPGPMHNGGKMTIGPDSNIYLVIGDVSNPGNKANNYNDGPDPDGSSVIYRITQDGTAPRDSQVLGENDPMNKFYAYGIRNSYGMDFDPVTGNLWDTENGPSYGDEINLVEPGFNSGWKVLQGIWQADNDFVVGDQILTPRNLTSFDGRGKYSHPEFIWQLTVGPTSLKFLNSDKLGKEYENDMFVGDINNGNLYHFDLDKQRRELLLDKGLDDKIVNNNNELSRVMVGTGFGGISDLEVGPDGYLYVVSIGLGSIHKIKHIS